jgi:large subunit ribosomal protein L13
MKTKESYMTTFHPKSGDLTRKWYVIDATDVVLGRLATHAADLLRGKGKPIYAPNVDCGDNVIIINADKVHISSNKRDREFRYRHSGYPGGLKTMSLGRSMELHPERVIADAVVGMMPHNRLNRESAKKLRVFAGSEHPFAAQKPESYEIKKVEQ